MVNKSPKSPKWFNSMAYISYRIEWGFKKPLTIIGMKPPTTTEPIPDAPMYGIFAPFHLKKNGIHVGAHSNPLLRRM